MSTVDKHVNRHALELLAAGRDRAGADVSAERDTVAEALFASIGDGAIATDEFGRITRVNPVAQELLGYTEAELIDEWFPKKIVAVTDTGAGVNLIDRPITRAFLTGQTIVAKTNYRLRNGDILPVAVTVSPVLVDGEPIGAMEVFRDISLEQEIDRMKSEFISLASHQLRTPLSAIQTYAHMLVDGYMGDISGTQKKTLHTILSAANRMNELISTLLNITRMESGSIAVSAKLIRADRLCEEVMGELKHLADDKQLRFELHVSGTGRPTIRTDNLILKEILGNLTSNAIKYTPDGGYVSINLMLRERNIMVSVNDTGWGIPLQAQDQVFSKFFRGHNIIKQETTGTGLGLYLVKGLVDAIGGSIWFKSQEGKGTHFFVRVPRTVPKRRTAAAGV